MGTVRAPSLGRRPALSGASSLTMLHQGELSPPSLHGASQLCARAHVARGLIGGRRRLLQSLGLQADLELAEALKAKKAAAAAAKQ